MFNIFSAWSKKQDASDGLGKPHPSIDTQTATIDIKTALRSKDEYTDWEPRHDDWHELYVCHCGDTCRTIFGPCPKCGCKSEYTLKVCRREWEFSPSLMKALFGLPQAVAIEMAKRNIKMVIWKKCECETPNDSKKEDTDA